MPVMLGQSSALMAVRAQLLKYAGCDVQVLVEGETGTGKELAAREIHYASRRRDRPFVPVNCGAIPEGLVENELFGHERGAYTDARCAQDGLVDRARGGTLFLDEVDALSSKAQVTLLRFLEDNEYRPVGSGTTRLADVRIIAATNSPLEQQVLAGRFRSDLHYRLNALSVRLPPLRERPGDVWLLAEHFVDLAAKRLDGPSKRWGDDALQALARHSWPGNVRELQHVALRAYVRADDVMIGLADLVDADPLFAGVAGVDGFAALPLEGTEDGFSAAKNLAIRAFERHYLLQLMHRAGGNVSVAARLSGTERRQLGKLLKKHGIETKQFRCQ